MTIGAVVESTNSGRIEDGSWWGTLGVLRGGFVVDSTIVSTEKVHAKDNPFLTLFSRFSYAFLTHISYEKCKKKRKKSVTKA